MDNNDQLMYLEKRNFWLRILTIVILLVIASSIIYFKFGYENPDDSSISDILGRNVTCRQALIYYAEHEWGYDFKPNFSNSNIPQMDFNLSE